MAREAAAARFAEAAAEIDLADDALTRERGRAFHDLADEFMAGNAAKAHVALQDLQIRRADARQPDAHDGFAARRLGLGMIFSELEVAAVPVERSHVTSATIWCAAAAALRRRR